MLYIGKPQKHENCFDETKIIKKKTTKPVHSFQNYAHIYKVEILNSSNPELQLKNTESVIKNKLKRV